jgi:hypothetical protein
MSIRKVELLDVGTDIHTHINLYKKGSNKNMNKINVDTSHLPPYIFAGDEDGRHHGGL